MMVNKTIQIVNTVHMNINEVSPLLLSALPPSPGENTRVINLTST